MAFNFVPAGTILSYGGASAPAGWLLCDGSVISRTTYAALFAALSTAWGYGDTSSTFNLPDLRGRFLRGKDGGAGRDPGDNRTPANTGGNTGDAVGSVQPNATKKNGLTASADAPAVSGSTSKALASGATVDQTPSTHTHTAAANTMYNYGAGTTLPTGSGNRDFLNGAPASGASGAHSHNVSGTVDIAHTHTAPTVTIGAGDAETRPLNANVNYIIKV